MEETKENRVEYKIYQIVCNQTGEIYIGKTTRTLEIRLYQHKKFLDCTSKQIIERGDYKIEEIDSTFDEEESVRLERLHIENNECINIQIPGRSDKEYYQENREKFLERRKDYYEAHKEEIAEKQKEYREKNKEEIAEKQKKYYQENREKFSEKKKEYREKNKEEIAEKQKEWREAHKEEIAEKRKEWREEHKEEIAEKRKEKYTCECGSTLTIIHKRRHERSQRHINYINSKK